MEKIVLKSLVAFLLLLFFTFNLYVLRLLFLFPQNVCLYKFRIKIFFTELFYGVRSGRRDKKYVE